jgi:hypothetical protein
MPLKMPQMPGAREAEKRSYAPCTWAFRVRTHRAQHLLRCRTLEVQEVKMGSLVLNHFLFRHTR